MNPSRLLPIIIAVVVSASLTVDGHYVRPRQPALIYLFKPLTTILILTAALIPDTWRNGAYAGLIALGLFFSLLGDILLMLPSDHFVQGLVSFLLAHICYGLAFLSGASARGFGLGAAGACCNRRGAIANAMAGAPGQPERAGERIRDGYRGDGGIGGGPLSRQHVGGDSVRGDRGAVVHGVGCDAGDQPLSPAVPACAGGGAGMLFCGAVADSRCRWEGVRGWGNGGRLQCGGMCVPARLTGRPSR